MAEWIYHPPTSLAYGRSFTLQKDPDMHATLQDNKVILTLSGRIDFSSRQHLHTLIDEWLAKGCTDFLLDLHEVGVIDSVGLGALIACSSAIQKQGGHLALTRLPKRLCELMQLTRLTHFFEICDPEQVAVSKATQ
jgi:anti-anti-sigma factor